MLLDCQYKIKEILALWNITYDRVCLEHTIPGSPERTDFRVVVESDHHKKFLLEMIPQRLIAHKLEIIKTLDFLQQRNVTGINPYWKNGNHDFISVYKESYWQVSPFIVGKELQRPQHVFESWRGEVLADFLIEMQREAKDIYFFDKQNVFSLPSYISPLMEAIQKNKPDVYQKYLPFVQGLEEHFFKVYKDFPVAFCHGDYHPINVVWGERDIRAVIDWEFLGYKPEIYDLANMIGCVGIENPEGLTKGLVAEFIKQIQKSKIFSEVSWANLVDFILAIRFAWLSEWLRKSDEEMMQWEQAYMQYLLDHKEELQETWQGLRCH